MIKTIEQGFKICPDIDGCDAFLFDTYRPKKSVDFAISHGYKRVQLNPFHGFTALNLNDILPLKDYIEELVIGTEKVSYIGLGEFSKLTLLSALDNGKDIIDLSRFPYLQTLNCSATKRLKGLETCKWLKKLTIIDYKAGGKDLTALPLLPKLQELFLIGTTIESLQGMEFMTSLKKLRIYNAKKLKNISSLESLSNNLKEIEIEKSKRISDFDILGRVKSLRKIILSESGKIGSLAFIKDMPNLAYLVFLMTDVLDGNLSYCEGLKYVSFDNKKHYTHRLKQIGEAAYETKLIKKIEGTK